MKKILLLATVTVSFISCSMKIIPVKGNYPQPPIQITTQKTFDDVWDKLVDLFAQNGFSIKIIDRSSGLLIAGSTNMPATYEDKNFKLVDPNAFIVVPKYYDQGTQKYYPVTKVGAGPYATKEYLEMTDRVSAEWNVRIKKSDSGTLINVNLVNLSYTIVYDKTPQMKPLTEYKSTGVFEKLIIDLITK